ncbi:type II secretion system F family protein [Candidatus Photodesmus anomalopis]|uniref:General secretion pathway protein F n=1 Tax=Candidatus Photodesmus katoptron Akat1 TaxID=1236703 RepID=S3EH63_9GAMM|nr:type II secretion system F family protein [Candidatus Photodesmus katoptron]EPE37528.1 general secretion pathway protein F [Candidatus Photodesmus katoptron Akat1]
MYSFKYEAVDHKGYLHKGRLEANHAKQARSCLREQGLIPIYLIQTFSRREKNRSKHRKKVLYFKKGISTKNLALITYQLSILVRSGIPLAESIGTLSEQANKPHISSMLSSIQSKVSEGYTLSDSLLDYPHIFNNLFCSMVSAGEKSGNLAFVLEQLANYQEKRKKIQFEFQQAMIYPAILIVFSSGIFFFLLTKIVPKITEPIIQLDQKLPTSTYILLELSQFIQEWGIYFLYFLMIFFCAIQYLLTKTKFRLIWDKKILFLPIIGKISRGLNTSKFSHTLAICTSSSLPIIQSMSLAIDVISNQYLKKKILLAADKVKEGTSLYQALSQTKLFSPIMLHMIASGELSGELAKMLVRSANTQDADFISMINIALGIFTPTVIILISILILFIVMATLMPMLEINNLLNQ